MHFVRTKFQFYTNNESLKTPHKTETTTILVTLVGTVGMFWFVRIGITEAKNSTLGGKEHNVLSLYGSCTGCPNLI